MSLNLGWIFDFFSKGLFKTELLPLRVAAGLLPLYNRHTKLKYSFGYSHFGVDFWIFFSKRLSYYHYITFFMSSVLNVIKHLVPVRKNTEIHPKMRDTV